MSARALAAGVLLATLVVAGLARNSYEIGTVGDDAHYYLGALSLAESGRYLDLTDPERRPQRHFLPGYPLLLAPSVALFPETPAAPRVATACLMALSLAAVALLAAELLAWPWALAVAAWMVLLPLTGFLATSVLSEVPFLGLSAALLLARVRAARSDPTGDPGWSPVRLGLALALLAACWIRPVGISLAVGLGAWAAAAGRRREAALDLATALVFLATYSLWSAGADDLYAGELAGYASGMDGLAAWAAGVARKLSSYAVDGSGLFVPWPELHALGAFGRVAGYGLAGAAVLGLARGVPVALQGPAAPLVWVAGAHLGILLLWPNVTGRYLWPLAPLVYIVVALGFADLSRARPALTRALYGLCLVVAIGHAVGLQALVRGDRALVAQGIAHETYAWLAAETPPESLLAAEVAGPVTLYTTRPCLRLRPSPHPDTLMRETAGRGARFLVLRDGQGIQHNVGGTSEGVLDAARTATARLLRSSPFFEARYGNAFERTTVFSVPADGVRFDEAFERFEAGQAALEAGQRDAAREHLEAALVGDPRLVFARISLGALLYEAGDAAGAVDVITPAVAAWPAYPLARINLAKSLAKAGRRDEARRHAQAARELARPTAALVEDARVAAEAERLLARLARD